MNYAAYVAQFARIAEEKGMVNSLEGNLSVIDRQTGNIYITPSHKAKLLLQEEQICVMDPQGQQIAGTCRRSSEYLLHEAAYKARPDIGAVLHCHTPYLTAYALAYKDLVSPETAALREVFGTIQCLPYGTHGTHEIHQGIEEALSGHRPVALLGGHGAVIVGEDLEDVLGIAQSAENFAKALAVLPK